MKREEVRQMIAAADKVTPQKPERWHLAFARLSSHCTRAPCAHKDGDAQLDLDEFAYNALKDYV